MILMSVKFRQEEGGPAATSQKNISIGVDLVLLICVAGCCLWPPLVQCLVVGLVSCNKTRATPVLAGHAHLTTRDLVAVGAMRKVSHCISVMCF